MVSHIKSGLFLFFVLFLGVICVNGKDILLEDFSSSTKHLWKFGNGSEYPGAKGSFSICSDISQDNQKTNYYGSLNYDFSQGGAYVCAKLNLEDSPNWQKQKYSQKKFINLAFDIFKTEEVLIKIRITTPDGQTFQKPVRTPNNQWARVNVSLDSWEVYWGGKKDGIFTGTPNSIVILADKLTSSVGAVFFDNISISEKLPDNFCFLSYPIEKIISPKDWSLENYGQTTLSGKNLILDFSGSTKQIYLHLPDNTLPGNPKKLILSAKNHLPGLRATLRLHSHFMTFYKDVEAIQNGERWEISTELPPGNDWKWSGGENGGAIYAPLRMGSITFRSDSGKIYNLEDFDISIATETPYDSCLMQYAQTTTNANQILFTWNGFSVSPNPIEATLSYDLKDWEGNVISQQTRKITIPPACTMSSETFTYEFPTNSYNFLEASFTLKSTGLYVEPITCTWLGNFPRNNDFTKDLNSPFGMGIYLYRLPYESIDKVAHMAAEAGVKWSREEFNWNRIERSQGEYHWDFYDHVVNSAEKYGIQVYGLAAYWGRWTKPYTEEGIEDYLHFLRACVTRYHGRIWHWEIWNEPNIFFWQGDKELYAELLKRAYQTIKEIDPNIQVLGISTAGIDFDFIEKMIKLEAPFDILTIHPYRAFLKEKEFINDLQRAEKQILQNGVKRPIWNTEMGWATYVEHPLVKQGFHVCSERKQAELIVRAHLSTIVSGINPKNFWYNFRNDGNDPWYFEANLGITRRDFSPKPAYAAFSTMTHVLKNTEFDTFSILENGAFIARFKPIANSQKAVIVVWAPEKTLSIPLYSQIDSNTEDVLIDSDQYSLTHILNTVGEEKPVVEANTIKINTPVYIILESK